MKSEPSEYSITDLARDGVGQWDGIRNYQVRNMMRDEMRVGDKALFYHSNAGAETGVVGEMNIIRAAYPDPTQFEPTHDHYDPKSTIAAPRWLCVDVAYRKTFDTPFLLSAMRTDPQLQDFALLRRGNRLSILPVTVAQYNYVRTHMKRNKAV